VRACVRAVALGLFLFSFAGAAHAETPIPPAPAAWVTDSAGLLSPQTVETQNARLRDYERATGHQILVYIAPTTGGDPIDDWAVRAFQAWKVGRKGLDDGLVLFIFTQDRALRIEVGYGLEAKVPDVLASRIIRNTIAPALAAGRPDAGVTAGIDQILQLTGGTASGSSSYSAPAPSPSTDQQTQSAEPLSELEVILIGFGVLLFLIVAIRSPWFAISLLVNIFSSRGGGGYSGGGFSGGGGGGGFSGGGGSSGGGGASGTW
jgi:uncharacterized protein